MTTMQNLLEGVIERRALERSADWLAVAVAVSLPWSTTATSILVVLWLLSVLPTLEIAAVRRELTSAAGGLPVLLWVLAALGLFWAHSDVSWSERLSGFAAFHRLLAIPVLLAQFRRSEHGSRVLLGFFASVTAVLILSWSIVLFPSLPWHPPEFGVPAKDYILQSENFLICAFILLAIALEHLTLLRWRSAVGLAAVAIAFLANIAFVASGRTTFLVAPVLTLLLGWRQWHWRGLISGAIFFCVLGAAAAVVSPYLRTRIETSLTELHAWRKTDAVNSTALHLQFLKEAISFVRTAPIIGHGTGSIIEQYRKEAVGETGAAAVASSNPHDQILAVGIQLGLVGIAVLLAMWVAHLALFRGGGLICWIGLVIVTENVVSSLVNSHLFDFTQAWIYIFGVGAAGGTVLRQTKPARRHETDSIAA